jgi:hypothetical protein
MVLADGAGKERFKIGQPNIVRPAITADLNRMAAFVIRAVDK